MFAQPPKIVLPGGSGFLGKVLARHFHDRGWQVVVLSRRAAASTINPADVVHWDGRTLGDWRYELEGATAVVNLAGRSVNCRYHATNRREILASRVASTLVLGKAIAACNDPPKIWLNSSTATIYKHSLDRPMDEATGVIEATREANDAFSIEVAQAWERAFDEAQVPATRKIALRAAMVLGVEPGTVYRVLRRLVCCGLGGAMAGGRQYVSWIHEIDFCRAVEWLITSSVLSGPVNLAAPQPLPNCEVMRLIRQACRIPFGIPATRCMLQIGAMLMRTETELIIKSRRVIPKRLLDAGFEFQFPNLAAAVADLESRLMANHGVRTSSAAYARALRATAQAD